MGKEVSAFVNEKVAAEKHTIEFKASDFASGDYIYRMDAGSFISFKKMILMK